LLLRCVHEPIDLRIELVRQFLRHVRGPEYAVPHALVETWQRFGHGRDVRQDRCPLAAGHGEQLELAGVYLREREVGGAELHLRTTGDRLLDRGWRALERNVRD